jgi:hypothetical protein
LDLTNGAEKKRTCALARQYKKRGMGARLEQPVMYNDDRHQACNEMLLPAATFVDLSQISPGNHGKILKPQPDGGACHVPLHFGRSKLISTPTCM